MVHNVFQTNIIELMSDYHQVGSLAQEQSQEYYSKLIHILNPSKNKFLLFGEKSKFNNLDFLLQNKNVNSVLYDYNVYFVSTIYFFFR